MARAPMLADSSEDAVRFLQEYNRQAMEAPKVPLKPLVLGKHLRISEPVLRSLNENRGGAGPCQGRIQDVECHPFQVAGESRIICFHTAPKIAAVKSAQGA